MQDLKSTKRRANSRDRAKDRLRRDMDPFLQQSEFTDFFKDWQIRFDTPVSTTYVLALDDLMPQLQEVVGDGDTASRKHKLPLSSDSSA